MAKTRAEVWLVGVLRGSAIMMGLAVLAVFMPFAWMDAIHRALGLGKLPDAPIVSYLARSLSAFYALGGAITWVLSFDVARYRRLLKVIASGGIVFGLTLLCLETRIGMPAYWVWVEGPFDAALGSLILVLLHRVETTTSSCV